jgi:hypothetical protein
MNVTTPQDTLASVMADAGALICTECGERTAVVVNSTNDANESLVPSGVYMIWCFECGHEEPVRH